MRTSIKAALVCLVIASVSVAGWLVWASPPEVVGGQDTFNPNKKHFEWRDDDITTSSTEWKRYPLIFGTRIKHAGPLVATITLKLERGDPAQFRFSEAHFKPDKVTLQPASKRGGGETFSFTAVLHNEGWTCTDPRLQWRSPTGEQIRSRFASIVVDYKVRNEQPDFACR